MRDCRRCPTQRLTGFGVALAGLGLVGVGAWGRREVRRGLQRERIVLPLEPGAAPRLVESAAQARSLAELIRDRTVEAASGRTYSETDQFLAPDGSTTSDSESALVDERTGQPVANPDYDLWISSTALQTALQQAYLADAVAGLTLGVGATFVAAGVGIAARR